MNVKYVCLNICSDNRHAFWDFIVGFKLYHALHIGTGFSRPGPFS